MKTPVTLIFTLAFGLVARAAFDPIVLHTDVSRVIELTAQVPAPVDADSVDYPAHLLHRVAPDYPRELRMRGIMGYAAVEVVVDSIGRVHSARLLETSHAAFGDAALDAAMDWYFEPALIDDRPVAVRVTIPFRFTIPGLVAGR